MDKREFSMFVNALKTYYPREKILPNEPAVALWYVQLADIPYKVATVALNKWVSTEKWSPSIADIRQLASEITCGELPDWGKGWEQVEKAIRKYGYYNELEALNSMDELTRQTTQRLGFKNICLSENFQNDRANFRMIYEELARRKKVDMQLSDDVKALISKMPLMIGGGE